MSARALALLSVFAGLACEEPTEAPLADAAMVNLEADAVLYEMADYLTSNGVRSGVILADTAYVFNDSSLIHMWGVDMTLFHEDGSERAHVTSIRGRLNQRTEQMLAQGDVVLVLDQGGRLVESSELHYDPASERIWSDSNSVYTNNGRITRGTCFRSNLDFDNITVCNIRGAADIGPGGPGGGGDR